LVGNENVIGVLILLEAKLISGITPIRVERLLTISLGTSVSRYPAPGSVLGIVNVPGKSVNVVL
jgi:hypothetical protein